MIIEKKTVDRPIFIIGTGRSGTTLLFEILARHPDTGWIPCPSYRTRFLEIGGRVSFFRRCLKHLWQPAVEPYDFWRNYTCAFSRPCRDLEARDLHNAMAGKIVQAVAYQLEIMERRRFLTKYTGWSRIGFTNAIFYDAFFINVLRDGRAVAWSLLQQSFWEGWKGPSQWRWGELSEENRALWERSNKSFYVLAGIQWKILMENLSGNASNVASRYLEVRYERLIASLEQELRHILEFIELPMAEDIIHVVRTMPVHNADTKWKMEVNPSELAVFEKLLGPSLEKYGY